MTNENLIYAILIGDGSHSDGRLSLGHSIKQYEYLLYKKKIIENILEKMDAKDLKIVETADTFIPAKTLNELNERLHGMGLGRFHFDKGYSEAKSLELGNKISEHFFDIIEKNPELKELEDQLRAARKR